MTEANTTDVRARWALQFVQRLLDLRGASPQGGTVRVRLAAEGEAFPEGLNLDLAFEKGRLAQVGLNGTHSPDVVIEGTYNSAYLFMRAALSVSEGVERGRFTLKGPDDLVEVAVGELDADVTSIALEAVQRERAAIGLALIKSGVTRPGLSMALMASAGLPADVVEYENLRLEELSARIRDGQPLTEVLTTERARAFGLDSSPPATA